MSKEVSEFFGGQLPSVTPVLLQAFAAVAQAQKSTGILYLRFSKQGEWTYGKEAIPVDEDEKWAVNPHSFQIGVIGWENGTLVGEAMFPITSPQRPNMDELPAIRSTKDGDGWKDQLSVRLRSLEDGTEVQWGSTSLGGKNAISQLMVDIGRHLEDPANVETPVMVVNLIGGESYMHTRYGKTFTPVLKTVDWYTMEGKPARKKLI